MGGDDDLKIAAPHFLRELHADLVRDVRRDLSGFKGLIRVMSEDTAGFVKPFLRHHHL